MVKRARVIPEDAVAVLETVDWTVYYSAFAGKFIFYTSSYHPRVLELSLETLEDLYRKVEGEKAEGKVWQ